MHANEEVITLNLKDVAILFLKRLWLILLAAIIAGGACFALLSADYEEEYTSKATIFLYYTGDVNSASAAASYLEVALYVVNDCEQILTSRRVLQTVVDEIVEDADIRASWRREVREMGYSGLRRSVSISNVPDSRVLEIAVSTSDPDLSKMIVDKICLHGTKQIEKYSGFEQVSIIDEGTINRYPSNSVSMTLPVAMAFLAGLVVFAIAFLIHQSNNKINNVADVEKYLGLNVLSEIPTFSSAAKNKKKYY